MFPFSTTFVICNDRHLYDHNSKLEVSENESVHNRRDTPNIRCANESKGKMLSGQCETNIQEITTLNSRG